MDKTATRALVFSATVAFTVASTSFLTKVRYALFADHILRFGLVMMAVWGWSLIGALAAFGSVQARGREVKLCRTIWAAMLLGVVSIGAVGAYELLAPGGGVLIGIEGVPIFYSSWLIFSLWWSTTSFVCVYALARLSRPVISGG
jgi:hypothetical protein